jgi:predicted RNA-binding protein YlxR (DUF448 family)
MSRTIHIPEGSAVGPQRTCVGCRQVDAQSALVRIARVGPRFRVDLRRRLPGRGAYVHTGCFDRAIERGGLARGFKTRVHREAVEGLQRQWSELSLNEPAEGAR